jgi:hypothetical protein
VALLDRLTGSLTGPVVGKAFLELARGQQASSANRAPSDSSLVSTRRVDSSAMTCGTSMVGWPW